MLKKILSVALCSVMLIGSYSFTAMAKSDSMAPKDAPVEVQLDYQSKQMNENGTTTYDVVNADEVAAFYGITDAKAVQATLFNRERKPVVAPQSVYIDNITGPRGACGAKEITRNAAVNYSNMTITKNITLTGGVSNTYSTNLDVGIKLDVASISAGVGFDVTDSWEMSDSTQVTLYPGQSVMVYAYPLYDIYRFDVINDPLFGGPEKVGFGDAFECKGFCTVVQ